MQQDKIYSIGTPGGRTYYFVVNEVDEGIEIAVFDEDNEPSKYTVIDQAITLVQLQIEDSPDKTRLMARIWDDTGDMTAGDPEHVLTLAEQEYE